MLLATRTAASGTSSHVRRRRRMLRSRTRRLEHVTEAAHGADPHPGGLELGAQARDIDLDRVVAQLLVPARQRLDDAVLGERDAWLGHEELHDRPLARGQV